jgi:thymidine kinase
MGKLTVIIGPMFASKSTELLRNVNRYEAIGKKVLVINHSSDVRYAKDSIHTHDGRSRKCISIESLSECNDDVYNYDAIVIDEAQFFKDLYEFVVPVVDISNHHVIVGALSGDYKREPIGETLRLIPHADEIIKLESLCSICNDMTPGLFTKRIVASEEQVLVGGSDSYIPVCRGCFLKELPVAPILKTGITTYAPPNPEGCSYFN